MHHQRLAVHLNPGNPDISVAAPSTLYDIAPLRGKAGTHHIVDLTGNTVEALSQIVALNLQNTVFCRFQTFLQKTGNQIGNTHGSHPRFYLLIKPKPNLTFLDLLTPV